MFGKYFESRTEQEKNRCIIDIKTLETLFKKEFNLDTYLVGGTLLGAMREKDFISKDNDIDIAYMSKYHNKNEVRAEFIEIINHLNSLQYYNNVRYIGHWWFGFEKRPDNRENLLDLWTSWIDEVGYYCCTPMGKLCSEEYILPLIKIKFRTDEFFVPKNSSKILDIYYNNWETIIQKDTNQWRKIDWKPYKNYLDGWEKLK